MKTGFLKQQALTVKAKIFIYRNTINLKYVYKSIEKKTYYLKFIESTHIMFVKPE